MQITSDKNGRAFLKADGKRIGITIAAGPWVAGVPADLIKLRPRGQSHFPREIRTALAVENNSDMTIDYFEADCIRLMPGHSLYGEAKAAA
jgi:hypothetical protein